MKKLIFAAIIVFTGILLFHGVIRGGDNFSFDYDYCLFKLEDDRLYLELYYSFYQNQLKFVKTQGGNYEAAGKLDIRMFETGSNKLIVQKEFKVPVSIPDTAGYNKNSILTGQVNFMLDSGLYNMKIIATDYYNPSDSSKTEHSLALNQFNEGKVCFSGLQVATGIQKSSDTKSVFYKNTLEVVPNPSRLFGNNLSTLYFYFELYNLNTSNLTVDYSIISSITDLNNSEIVSNEKKYKIVNESKAEYGSFEIDQLKTNPYYLVVKVVDFDNNEVARSQKKFFVYNSDTADATGIEKYKDDYLLSEFSKYTEKQADEEFRYALYIASDNEKTGYKNIGNLEGKRKFIYEFWNSRAVTLKGGVNKYRKEYFERIKYSNENFTSNFIDGWKTDRGRVYCIYGKPDEVERFPFQSDIRTYEIWHLNNVEGGVIFVFIDLSNSAGDFALVHSTARNEISDKNWKDKLRIK